VEDTEPAGNSGKRDNSEETRTASSEDKTVLSFLKVKSCCLLSFSVHCMKFSKHASAVPRDCICVCGVCLELKFIRVCKNTKV